MNPNLNLTYWPVDRFFPSIPGPDSFRNLFLAGQILAGELVGESYRQYVNEIEGGNGDDTAYGLGLTAPHITAPFLATYNLTNAVPGSVRGSQANDWLMAHIMAVQNVPGRP